MNEKLRKVCLNDLVVAKLDRIGVYDRLAKVLFYGGKMTYRFSEIAKLVTSTKEKIYWWI